MGLIDKRFMNNQSICEAEWSRFSSEGVIIVKKLFFLLIYLIIFMPIQGGEFFGICSYNPRSKPFLYSTSLLNFYSKPKKKKENPTIFSPLHSYYSNFELDKVGSTATSSSMKLLLYNYFQSKKEKEKAPFLDVALCTLKDVKWYYQQAFIDYILSTKGKRLRNVVIALSSEEAYFWCPRFKKDVFGSNDELRRKGLLLPAERLAGKDKKNIVEIYANVHPFQISGFECFQLYIPNMNSIYNKKYDDFLCIPLIRGLVHLKSELSYLNVEQNNKKMKKSTYCNTEALISLAKKVGCKYLIEKFSKRNCSEKPAKFTVFDYVHVVLEHLVCLRFFHNLQENQKRKNYCDLIIKNV